MFSLHINDKVRDVFSLWAFLDSAESHSVFAGVDLTVKSFILPVDVCPSMLKRQHFHHLIDLSENCFKAMIILTLCNHWKFILMSCY